MKSLTSNNNDELEEINHRLKYSKLNNFLD